MKTTASTLRRLRELWPHPYEVSLTFERGENMWGPADFYVVRVGDTRERGAEGGWRTFLSDHHDSPVAALQEAIAVSEEQQRRYGSRAAADGAFKALWGRNESDDE